MIACRVTACCCSGVSPCQSRSRKYQRSTGWLTSAVYSLLCCGSGRCLLLVVIFRFLPAKWVEQTAEAHHTGRGHRGRLWLIAPFVATPRHLPALVALHFVQEGLFERHRVGVDQHIAHL